MQNPLFDDIDPPKASVGARAQAPSKAPTEKAPPKSPARGAQVRAIEFPQDLRDLASALPRNLWLGSSTWTYPGWQGFVWEGAHSEAQLSRRGLPAYAAHPLLRSVCVDRAFYRPLTASQYAALAAQVPDDFRFVVKAPSLVTDATVRGEDGRGLQANPAFLDAALAVQEFVQPALDGLGHKLGALVFQLSPLPAPLLGRLPDVMGRLGDLLGALPSLAPVAPDGVVAVEMRDAAFIQPAFADLLRATGATFCLGLHAKMPPLRDQLPLLRALWPGPLVCRWNYNRLHGAYGYEEAEKRYAPFDRIVDADPDTRAALAKVIVGTVGAGQRAYVAISNKAEGSAPLSVIELAREVAGRMRGVDQGRA